MVVMNGLAMTAGSKPMRFASTGSEQPTSFAASTVTTSVLHTTMATGMVTRSMSSNLTKFAAASETPHKKATRASFQRIRPMSLYSISPRERPRMMETEA